MSDTPLSVRLPADLADALDCRATERGVGRSQVVREAVSAYLTSQPAALVVRLMPVATFLDLWATAPELSADEAVAYAADLRVDRASLGALDDPWG
jgi:hypothetical protein